MDGDLVVRSKKGGGSIFRLTILVKRVDEHHVTARFDTRLTPARSLSILCAEDNPYGRVVMNTILRELGHRVDFVETGEAAVEAVARGSYDAVLMDVMLAGLNGIEATRRVRALPGKAGQTPIICDFRSQRKRRRAGCARGRHEFLSREAGQPGQARPGAGGPWPLKLRRCWRLWRVRRSAPRLT